MNRAYTVIFGLTAAVAIPFALVYTEESVRLDGCHGLHDCEGGIATGASGGSLLVDGIPVGPAALTILDGEGAEGLLLELCPPGSQVSVELDGRHGSPGALLECNGLILNGELAAGGFAEVSGCGLSRFGHMEWAGC